MKFLTSLLSICLILNSCLPTSTQDSRIDYILSNWKDNTPGGAVGVFRNGEVIHSKGYGLADLEHEIPIVPSTVFYLGSMGKQFTAFSILLLEEQGKLKLDDDIRKYLEDFPYYGQPITIGNLLYHTSGLRDYSSLWDLQGEDYFDLTTSSETYNLIKNQKGLNSWPGEEKIYCNSGYFLLSKIVEEITGESFKEFIEKNIFLPLDMHNSIVLDDSRDLIPNRAFGYYKRDEGFDNAIRRFQLVGSGGVYSTVEDLYKWDQNFYNNQLGNGNNYIIDKMYKEGLLNDGRGSGEAAGLVNGTYRGLPTISHGGSHGGFKTELLRFPEMRLSVVVLANRSDASGTKESYEIADLFLQGNYKEQTESYSKVEYIKLDSTTMNIFVGDYLNLKNGTHRKILFKEESLFYYRRASRQDRLGALSANEFRMMDRGNPIMIKFNDGDTLSMSFYSGHRHVSTMHRIEPQEYSTEELHEFEGEYLCADIDRIYLLQMKEGELRLFLKDQYASDLIPTTLDVLSSKSFGTFFFKRNEFGDITGFTLNSSRVRGLEFIRNSGIERISNIR